MYPRHKYMYDSAKQFIDILDVYLRVFSLWLMNILVWFPILSIQADYLCKQVFCHQNSPIVLTSLISLVIYMFTFFKFSNMYDAGTSSRKLECK